MAEKKKVVVAFSGTEERRLRRLCSLCQHGRFQCRTVEEERRKRL